MHLNFFKTHHSDSIIEERFSKHKDVQQLIDVDLLKHSKDSHGVHSWDDRAKQQTGQQANAAQPGCFNLTYAIDHSTHKKGIPKGSHHCKHQDGAKVLCKSPDGQKVASIQDDRRQQIKEK